MHIVVGSAPGGVLLTPDVGAPYLVTEAAFGAEVARREAEHPRWVWDDTARWYPSLLAAGVRVERCIDLRLCHAILRAAAATATSELARSAPGPWDVAAPVERPTTSDGALFELDDVEGAGADVPADAGPPDPVAEWQRQLAAVEGAGDPGRIRRLLAAESAGALVAAEMRFAGMPWDAPAHDEILATLLGPRPRAGERPEKVATLLERVRELLAVPDLNLDSPAELLKGLAKGGVLATSTRSWELKKIGHPAIAPLLEYKKLQRLASANGWHWLDTWVAGGRFRPDYVVGGTATGRWATSGGGALQLPRQVRSAARADEGWMLVVADAAQLEPRILAAMAGDSAMVAAGDAGDLYAGIVASGAIDTREHAKVALLGAMYGATQGESGRLLPRLARAYPKAIALVEEAARAGERGETVQTRLGRTSPTPGRQWLERQAIAYGETATEADRARARSEARSWGRFTRNFIVQGTAAEWALCWMASLRAKLSVMSPGEPFTSAPHLVFFLHDEVVVHTPAHRADEVADAVREAAADAGRLLFGELPVQFPLTVAVVDHYGAAK